MKILKMPTSEHLHECFVYSGGDLYWKYRPESHFKKQRTANMWNAKFAGKRAGRKMAGMDYRQVGVDGVRYLEHRVIAAMFGVSTDACIDHKDRTGRNEIENLRPATQQQNSWNNEGWKKKSSRVGTWEKKNGKWVAYIRVGGSMRHLGTFSSESEAVAARVGAERLYYGEFAISSGSSA